tara:strand:+ start:1675 stop:2067 length:393 start_codon:yes stop_codon:yes gene_type:complete
MIIGVGSDIIDITRIDNTIKRFGNRFINRCFTKIEIDKSNQRNNRSSSFAKRFAAKEAFSKALGTGFSQGVFFKDIGVINNINGKPNIKLTGNALTRYNKLAPKGKKLSINITLTDENNLAYAMVIISSK